MFELLFIIFLLTVKKYYKELSRYLVKFATLFIPHGTMQSQDTSLLYVDGDGRGFDRNPLPFV